MVAFHVSVRATIPQLPHLTFRVPGGHSTLLRFVLLLWSSLSLACSGLSHWLSNVSVNPQEFFYCTSITITLTLLSHALHYQYVNWIYKIMRHNQIKLCLRCQQTLLGNVFTVPCCNWYSAMSSYIIIHYYILSYIHKHYICTSMISGIYIYVCHVYLLIHDIYEFKELILIINT